MASVPYHALYAYVRYDLWYFLFIIREDYGQAFNLICSAASDKRLSKYQLPNSPQETTIFADGWQIPLATEPGGGLKINSLVDAFATYYGFSINWLLEATSEWKSSTQQWCCTWVELYRPPMPKITIIASQLWRWIQTVEQARHWQQNHFPTGMTAKSRPGWKSVCSQECRTVRNADALAQRVKRLVIDARFLPNGLGLIAWRSEAGE